ncbi:hypothetical protein CP02DC21_1897 [Chlamydia psittaci 02DC21]|nr:hypothetical protein CP02DC21_1897 [Chlamydia psittaci 02DC21]EPP32814.1 hypothetical protein CPC698_1528 [Chlamydia psittaci C6/98]
MGSVKSSHRVTAFPSRSLSLRLFLCIWKVIFGSQWRAMVKKEISLVTNLKEAF